MFAALLVWAAAAAPAADPTRPIEDPIRFKETGLVMRLVRRCADKDQVNGHPDRETPPCRH